VLVNNAGGQFPQAAIDYSVKGWNAVIDTNLNGTWYMMQAAARKWRDLLIILMTPLIPFGSYLAQSGAERTSKPMAVP
jgi:NAD(P)-dependent dehydrogenase (short-subunit alcohol dehydrogenase family)